MKLLITTYFVANIFGCVSTPKKSAPTRPVVQEKTVLEAPAPKQTIAHKEVDIATKLVDARVILRPRVELRHGPGAAYFLDDQILAKGDKVILLESYQRWRKVYAPAFRASGWVHEKTISPKKIYKGISQLQIKSLPAMQTIHARSQLLDFVTKKKVGKRLPKGSRFYRLKKVKGKYLVLIKETMSVAWINEGDVI